MTSNIKHSILIAKARKNLRFGRCFKCNLYKRPGNSKKKRCSDDSHKNFYSEYEWLSYCKNNDLNPKTGKKKLAIGNQITK